MKRVEKALATIPDAKTQKVEIGSADVQIDAAHLATVLDAIRKAGYEPKHD